MKKTVSICFFAAFLILYTFGLSLLWNSREEKKETEPSELVEAESESSLEATESMQIHHAFRYYIYEKEGRLAVYESDQKTLFLETNIRLEDLDLTMQERVCQGIGFDSEGDLYDFLESYSS